MAYDLIQKLQGTLMFTILLVHFSEEQLTPFFIEGGL